MAAIPLKHDDVYYPESDGQPMAETDLHREVMYDLIHGLQTHYADAPEVYVSGNLFVYDVQGDPKSSFSPDAFVVLGVPKGRRRTFKLWEEGSVPCFIVEVTSESTRKQDLAKKDRYQRLGVEEYLLFDPLGDYLYPRIQGYRLKGGRYQPIKPAAPDGSLESQITGLTLRIEGERLRLINTVTGEKIVWADEQGAELKRTKEQVLREAEARQAAEEKAARERERADREAEARRAAEDRADREEKARRTLEEELARLRREMERRES